MRMLQDSDYNIDQQHISKGNGNQISHNQSTPISGGQLCWVPMNFTCKIGNTDIKKVDDHVYKRKKQENIGLTIHKCLTEIQP